MKIIDLIKFEKKKLKHIDRESKHFSKRGVGTRQQRKYRLRNVLISTDSEMF